MGLLELISKNEDLVFIDGETGAKFRLEQMLVPIPTVETSSDKALAFLYLDNGIVSTSVYLSFLDTPHTVALLSNGLDSSLKEKLEEEYRPTIIFDANRDSIKDYQRKKLSFVAAETSLFVNDSVETNINPKVKVLLSTSGTTGSPKFVKLSEENLVENAKSITAYLPIIRNDVTPLNLPLHYSYGLSVLHTNAISGGTIFCGVPDILNRGFWNMMEEHGFTSIAGVPFIYEMLHKIGFTKKQYPSLRYISQAGGNLSKNIKSLFNDYCQKNNIAFYVMYGQTEASARISYVPAELLSDKITSIGIPIKNGSLSLDSETEELLYSGPNVFGGYSRKKDDLGTWENINPLRTGDIAYMDDDGFFFIKGRLKRFVKIFGNRVNLDEIERLLKTELDLSLIACVGIGDKYILVSHCDEDLTKDQVGKLLFDKFKIHQSSIKVQYLDEMPLTSNGKINYNKISADFT